MISLKINGLDVSLNQGVFSDGALRLSLAGSLPVKWGQASITATSVGELPETLLFKIASLVNILRNNNSDIVIQLFMPYLPFARQDRMMVKNDAVTLNVFTSFLNSLNLNEVKIVDCHSDVGVALLNNVKHITQSSLVNTNPIRHDLCKGGDFVLVAPDAGALKKIYDVAKSLNPSGIVLLGKVRDTSTGQITGQKLLDISGVPDIQNRRCLIVDDICDGGRTFTGAAQVLKGSCGAKSVDLFVTHGIFSQGLDALSVGGLIDHIFTTDSICKYEQSEHLTVYSSERINSPLNASYF